MGFLRLKTNAAATIVSLGALLFSASAHAQTTAQATQEETEAVSLSQYGDWTYGCSGNECSMHQQLGNPEQPDIRYGISISRVKSNPNPVMRLTFPLGIYLPSGIGVEASDLKLDAPISVCLPAGCNAIFVIDEKFRTALIGTARINVRFYVADSNTREISFSQNGFLQSFNELIK